MPLPDHLLVPDFYSQVSIRPLPTDNAHAVLRSSDDTMISQVKVRYITEEPCAIQSVFRERFAPPIQDEPIQIVDRVKLRRLTTSGPKRQTVQNSFMKFKRDIASVFKNVKSNDISKIAGRIWKFMDTVTKKKYEVEANNKVWTRKSSVIKSAAK